MRTAALPITLILGLLMAACGGAPPAATPPADTAATVDEARAVEIATNAFSAFDAGDYAGWSRDWSEAMTTAIPREAFEAWRASVIEQLGQFVALGAPVRSSRTPGTYRWSFPARFERGTATVGFAFVDGGDEVEGVFVE